ncbi:murein biosynthesis integral membrane protein MurJ [Enemella sp. A6]|uniref:murein biosynthesis integral membrane protein MurJ n=1 Tax=Enemella sp. A6 TaxID=3440152 RepID=UPI003EBD8FAE
MTPRERQTDESLDPPDWVNDSRWAEVTDPDSTAPFVPFDDEDATVHDDLTGRDDPDPIDDETDSDDQPAPTGTAATGTAATKRLLSASAVMASGTLLSRVFGFIRTAMIAFVLGNGTRQVDMFTLANTIPNSLYILLAGGALNTVLVPQIVRAVKKDPDGGDAYTNRIMTAFLTIILVVTVLITIGAPGFVWLYTSDAWKAPALAAQYESMVTLAYFCLPQIFFYGAFFLAGQVLNARERFGPMMWAPIANNVVSIGVLSLYLFTWGSGGDGSGAFTARQEMLLGLGSTFGILVQAAILVPYLRLAGFRYRPRFDWRGVGLGHTFSLAKWTLGFVAVTQLALVVINKLATSATAAGEGAGLTAYNNAYLLWIMPHSLITVSLATAMLPSASRLAEAGDLAGVRNETLRTMKLAVTVLLPVSVGFIALAGPIVQLLFGNGAGAEDARYIGWTLMTLAVGLVPFTLHYICLRALYALEDTRSAFLVQIVIAIANVGFAMALVVPFHRPSLVAAGLGLAYSLAYLVGLYMVLRILQRKLPELSLREIGRHLVRLFLAVLPGAGAALLVVWLGEKYWSTSFGPLALTLLVAGLAAIAGFLLGSRLLNLQEVRDILGVLRRRGGNPESDDTGPQAAVDAETVEQLTTESNPPTDPDATLHPPAAPSPEDDCIQDADEDEDTAVRDSAAVTDEPAEELVDTPAHARLSLGEDDMPTSTMAPVGDESDEETTIRPLVDGGTWQATAGQVLGDRYELEEIAGRGDDIVTWRAFDSVLSRSVLVHLLEADDSRTRAVLDAARRSAVATDARFLRVLDVVDDETGPYVVSEFAPGRSLQLLLSTGPLSARESAWLVREIADALSVMHAQGLYHERISPETVIITPTGNIKIAGFLISSALHPDETSDDPEHTDVRDLGRMLYATVVSRWPGGPAHGLPAAPQSGSRLLSPRQVRAGVSPALDRLCEQILGDPLRHGLPPLSTAQEVVGALSAILGTTDASQELEARIRYPVPVVGRRDVGTESPEDAYHAQHSAPPAVDDPAESTGPIIDEEPNRRWLSLLIGFVLLVFILSLIGVFVQRQLGTTGPAQPHPTSESDRGNDGPVEIAEALDFDPSADGGNDEENPDETALAHDGDPDTRWRTLSYRGNPKLGGLKPGVGLVVDLGEPTDVTAVKLWLSGDGTDVEVRVPGENAEGNEAPMNSQTQWRTVATQADAEGEVTLNLEEGPEPTRWVLVYLTSLPPEDGNYRGGIFEIEVQR